ncbi:hypothetical protein IW152_000761 [Coemansia sp. BCRC 34962]|nr:hypothetical protein IW152_000761 [Coemansia sp. BCRC 34962]
MDSSNGLPAFEELPPVFQARIRDIQQEFMDGDITPKGYDKRMAKIVQDYQSTVSTAQEMSGVPVMLSEAHRTFTTGNEGVDCDFSAMRVGSRSGVVDTKAFYDARKSTVVGFRKPGINFDALLDDFDDDDMGLQALSKSSSSGQMGGTSETAPNGLSRFGFGTGTPPVPELPENSRAAYPVAPSIEIDGAGYDDDLTSGRAYNVLSDIMDPYGSQLTQANQELYSDDDSSSDGILDDIDGLSPAGISSSGISPGIIKQHGPSGETRDTLSSAPLEPVAIDSRPYVNGGPTGDSDHQYAQADDLRRQILRQTDAERSPTDQADCRSDAPLPGVALDNGQESMDIQRSEMRLPVPRSSSTSGVSGPRPGIYNTPSSVNLLTPDTPTVGQFGAANFGAGSTFTDTIRTPKQSGKARYPEYIAGLSPVSGIHSTEDEQASSNEVGASDSPERFGGRYSMHSSTTDQAATTTSGVGTITLEDMAQAASGSDFRARTELSPALEDQAKDSLAGNVHSISFSRSSKSEAHGNRAALPDAWVTSRPSSPAGSSPLVAELGPAGSDEPASRSQYSFGISSGHAASARIGSSGMAHVIFESGIVEPNLGADSSSIPMDNASLSSSAGQHQRPSIQSVAFGSYGEDDLRQANEPFPLGQPASHGFPYPGEDFGDDRDFGSGEMQVNFADSPKQQQAIRSQPSMSTINNRLGRRPTYSTRSDRRPLVSMAGGGMIGRASYYSPEAQPEIPANFDVHLLPNIDPAMVVALESAEASSSVVAPGLEDNRDSLADYAFEHALPYHTGHEHGGAGLNPVITDFRVAGSNQAAQYAFEQSGGYGTQVVSMTAPVERQALSHSVEPRPAPNSAPLLDIHSPMAGQGGYDGEPQAMYEDWSAEAQPLQQQQAELSSIGAILYPREIPDEVYSSKLKSIMEGHESLPSVLRFRAAATPNEIAYTCIDTKGKEIGSWTWAGLHTRAIQVVQLVLQRGVSAWGDRVALVYRKYEMLDFVGSLFGCFYAGLCAVPIVAGDSYAELVHVLQSTSSALVLTTELNTKALQKDISQNNVGPGWPTDVSWVRTDNLGGCVLSAVGVHNASSQYHSRAVPEGSFNSRTELRIDEIGADDLAYIEFSKSPNGELKGVQVTHGAIMRQCAVWMMSTGMLDIGRKYKHRVELEEHETAVATDYSLGLADPTNELDADSTPSTPLSAQVEQSSLDAQEHGSTAVGSPSAADHDGFSSGRGSIGKKWGSTSGFLGRLRNVGSLPKMRRGSRGRESSIASADGKQGLNGSARNSVAGQQQQQALGGGRVRAASNLSTLLQQSQQVPRGDSSTTQLPSPAQKSRTRLSAAGRTNTSSAANEAGLAVTIPTPSANVGVFQDVVMYYIEPRQHFGLVYGIFGGCYGGHQSVYASSAVCEIPGAYINMLTRYRVTVAVGDYTGLQAVLSTATDEPGQIIEFSKKVAPNLACLRLCLVDTLFIDPVFHATFDKNVLHRFGCPYQSIADTEGHPVVTAVCTLAEHGSMLMAMRDSLTTTVGTQYEFVLDRAAFRENRIAVLPDEKNEAEVDRIGTVRYQSFGFPALSATIAVVDPETRELCAGDAIGELWISSASLGSGFWGLPKLSSSIFAARFTYSSGELASSNAYLRTGLMGAVVQGRVLVFGFYEDRIRTLTIESAEPSLGFHYAGDINSTIRRYLPQVSECTAFEMFANDTHFPVIAAEVRHNSGAYATVAEEIYGVLRSRHGLHAYAVALCPPNSLPRAFQYGKRTVNAQLCRHQFESGRVNCLYVKLSTDHLFVNLPPPAHTLPPDDDFVLDPSVALYGRWLQQTSLESPTPSVDEPSATDLRAFSSITELLVWRAAKYPEQVAYTQFDDRGRPLKPMTFAKLLTKVSAVAQLMLEKRRVSPGDHVLVAIAPSPSFAVAIHACLAIGAVPIAIAPPDVERLSDDLPPLLVTAREFQVNFILVDQLSEEIFRSKMMEAAMRVQSLRSLLGSHRMPAPLSVAKASKSPKHLLGQHSSFRFSPQWADPARTALVMQFTGAQASTPQYVSYTHKAILGFCSQQKGDFQMLPTLPVIASVRAYNGYGLLHCTMIGVYVGCMTLLLSPVDFFASPAVWFELVQRYNVKDAFTTLPMLQHAMNFLSAYVGQYRFKLGAVRNFIVATEERVDPQTYANIRDFFAHYGLSETAINPLYGTLMNPCISTRAYLGVSPLSLRLDIHAMRRARVVALPPLSEVDNPEEAELHSVTLQDSGKVSGSTMVAIVDPATRLALPAGCIGEVWVCSDSNAARKQTPVVLANNGTSSALQRRPLMTISDSTGCLDGNQENVFVRTGDLGFLYLQVAASNEREDSAPAEPYLFVAGRIAETFNVSGYMHFYSDVERAVEEPCEDIVQGSCVVIQTTLHAPVGATDASSPTSPLVIDSSSAPRLVAVISLRRAPSDSFLPNSACLIFNNVLDRHQVLLDEIVFVPRDALPRSRISERRRRTVRGLYESGKLNAYVNFPISNSTALLDQSSPQLFLGAMPTYAQ